MAEAKLGSFDMIFDDPNLANTLPNAYQRTYFLRLFRQFIAENPGAETNIAVYIHLRNQEDEQWLKIEDFLVGKSNGIVDEDYLVQRVGKVNFSAIDDCKFSRH
jgi:hypothetical protein